MSVLELNYELQKLNKKNEKIIKDLIIKNIELKDKLQNEKEKNSIRFKQSSKNYFDLEKSSARKIKLRIYNFFKEINSNLNNIGLNFEEVCIKKLDKNADNFELDIREYFQKNNSLEKVLNFKDKYYISDHTFQMMRMNLGVDFPSLYKIRKQRQLLNNSHEYLIQELSSSFVLKVKERIIYQIKYFLENSSSEIRNVLENNIKIKFSLDQTSVGRKLKLINLTFTLISEGKKALSASGNYTLGILLCKENYKELKDFILYVMKEISELKEFSYKNQLFKIDYFCGADGKVLSQILGLTGPRSNYPCIWCTVHKKQLSHLDYKYSIMNEKHCRSIKNQYEMLKKSKFKEVFGYRYLSLLTQIDFKNCILDTLHLFLRVSDRLMDLLVSELCSIDKVVATSVYDPVKHPTLSRFFYILNYKCKLKVEPFISLNRGKLSICRDLRGPEKISLFKNINIAENFKDIIKRSENVNKIWNDFYLIYQQLLENTITSFEMKTKSRDWYILFSNTYNSVDHVTPYIHAFVHHVHEFIELTNNINIFNVQGIEKLNDITTSEYFRATNKSKDFLLQMLNRRLRIERALYFNDQSQIVFKCGTNSEMQIDDLTNRYDENSINDSIQKHLENSFSNMVFEKSTNDGNSTIFDHENSTESSNIQQHIQNNIRTLKINKTEVLLDLVNNKESWLQELNIIYALQIIKQRYANLNISCKIHSDLINRSDNKPNSIFILNTGNHWVTFTNIKFNDSVDWIIYDSLNNICCLNSLKNIFKKLFDDKIVTIQTTEVFQQKGSNDCGLFAIAYAISLCCNQNPALLQYDQTKMREHYNNCVDNEIFDEFISTKIKKNVFYIDKRLFL